MTVKDVKPSGLLQLILLLVTLHCRVGEAVNFEGQCCQHFPHLFVRTDFQVEDLDTFGRGLQCRLAVDRV